MGKLLAPNTTIWWVPDIEDVNAPTDDEIEDGVNISCAIVTGYTLGFTDPETDGTRSICDETNVDTPTRDNYEASMQFFRSDLLATTAVYDLAFNLFKKKGNEGFFVRRIGKKNSQPVAVADQVEVFKVQNDYPRTIESDNNGPYLMEVPFVAKGLASNGIVSVVAA